MQQQPMAYPPPQSTNPAYPPGGYPPAGPGMQPGMQPGPAYGGPGAPAPPGAQPWQPGQDARPSGGIQDPGTEHMAIDGFKRFNGYENVGRFGEEAPMAPPPPPPKPSGEAPMQEFDDNLAKLTEEQCRSALLQFVAEHCCYGKKPAQEHSIDKIIPSSALHYILETFCEGRTTGYVHEPFRGQPIDGPENGMPPPPWTIPCQPNTMFDDHVKRLEVPHTAVVKICHRCQGCGWNRCSKCGGDGRVRCTSCGGDGCQTRYRDGESYRVSCSSCGGDGQRRCGTCGGDGRVTCRVCQGYRNLKCYIQLTVTFMNHKSDFIMEKTDMPDELIRDVAGRPIFEQTLPQVWPIVAYPVQDINDNSVRLVESHRVAFQQERQLNQRQTLRAVPVTEVHYKWKEYDTRYWIYGKEHKVHSPDYPHQCCWGCTII